MFAYCNNNPIINQDPSGELLITTLILIGAIAVGGGVAVYTGVKAREAGCGWGETLLHSFMNGLMAFSTVYTYGMTAYGCYQEFCYLHGMTPITEIGSSQTCVTQIDTPPVAEAQHLSGTGSPEKNATPNGSYTKLDNSGNIYSYTQFNSDSQQTMRIDFQGRPHAGVLPHIHLFVYLERGGRAEYIFNKNWDLIN